MSENVKKQLKSIDASLKYGRVLTGKWLAFLYAFITFCAITPISSIVYLFLVLYGVEIVDNETILVLLLSNALSILIILGVVYVLYKNNRLKKKIILWLEDAVELSAQTTTLDMFKTIGHPVAETRLQVQFDYCGIAQVQSSYDDTKKDHWYKRNGFFKILSKYADKTIRILYSPKYEQVLIMKK